MQNFDTLKFFKFMKHNSSYYNSNVTSLSPEIVLSRDNKNNCIQLLQSTKSFGLKPKPNVKKAAVLVPLYITLNNEVALLYTVRSPHLKVNGGDVSFPGGVQEKHDVTLKDTMLRETLEEIGIKENNVDIWAKGPDIHRPDVIVTPFLGYIKDLKITNLNINSREVSSIFCATLKNLSCKENFRTTQFRLSKTHVYRTPVYIGMTKKIWGLTAVITHVILSALIPCIYKKNIIFDSSFHRILGIKIH